MFETETYEVIKKRILDRIPNNLDKNQTSVAFNTIAPVAIELAQVKIDNDTILRETFATTADRTYLIERGKESGYIVYGATHAVVKGVFYNGTNLMDVPIESRFTCGTLIYKVTEKISLGIYKLTCETAGTIGNENSGTIIPVEYIKDLTKAEIVEILIPGEDEEDTEVFRERYLSGFNAKAYGGNRADYIEKVNAISGVGGCKPKRITALNNPIEITIINSSFGKASDVLVEEVQNIIDPLGNEDGNGIAPYNHIVHIKSVEEKNIKVSIDAVYDTGYSFDLLKKEIEQKIENYLLGLRQNWANENNIIVRLAILQSEILTITGILDMNSIKINDRESNAILTEDEIPVFSEVVDE